MPQTDLLVINPAASHGIYGNDLASSLIAVEPPLWCRLIAGYARVRGYTVQIIDAEAVDATAEQIAGYVDIDRPRLVCIAAYGHQPSASTQQMHGASQVAKAIKQLPNAPPIIMVGGHVAALTERTMKEEAIDFACNGEGPTTILGLLAGASAMQIPGLAFRDSYAHTAINAPAELIDVNDFEDGAWDLVPIYQYRAHNWQCFGDLEKRKPYASIFTSLGCPYKCSFCCINAPFKSNRYRMRSPVTVANEIYRLYHKYGVKTFKIIDELFVLNERHYTAICEHIISFGIGDDINIWCYARVDTVKPDKLALLRKAGIRWLALGIESASAYVRDGAQKRLKNDDITSVVRDIQAADINVIGNFIFGLPDDDLDSMQATLNLAVDLNCEFANFYSAMAYPGSPLYAEAVQKGWRLPDSWRGYSQHNDDCRPLDTNYVDAATVLRFRDEAFNIYFRNPRYLDMVESKFGIDTVDHIKSMTTFKLKRKLLDRRYVSEERASAH